MSSADVGVLPAASPESADKVMRRISTFLRIFGEKIEGFFGTLKSDFFDGRDWSGVTFEEFSERLDGYIEWYRGSKLKKSLGWKTIRQRRVELGYAA